MVVLAGGLLWLCWLRLVWLCWCVGCGSVWLCVCVCVAVLVVVVWLCWLWQCLCVCVWLCDVCPVNMFQDFVFVCVCCRRVCVCGRGRGCLAMWVWTCVCVCVVVCVSVCLHSTAQQSRAHHITAHHRPPSRPRTPHPPARPPSGNSATTPSSESWEQRLLLPVSGSMRTTWIDVRLRTSASLKTLSLQLHIV